MNKPEIILVGGESHCKSSIIEIPSDLTKKN